MHRDSVVFPPLIVKLRVDALECCILVCLENDSFHLI